MRIFWPFNRSISSSPIWVYAFFGPLRRQHHMVADDGEWAGAPHGHNTSIAIHNPHPAAVHSAIASGQLSACPFVSESVASVIGSSRNWNSTEAVFREKCSRPWWRWFSRCILDVRPYKWSAWPAWLIAWSAAIITRGTGRLCSIHRNWWRDVEFGLTDLPHHYYSFSHLLLLPHFRIELWVFYASCWTVSILPMMAVCYGRSKTNKKHIVIVKLNQVRSCCVWWYKLANTINCNSILLTLIRHLIKVLQAI